MAAATQDLELFVREALSRATLSQVNSEWEHGVGQQCFRIVAPNKD